MATVTITQLGTRAKGAFGPQTGHAIDTAALDMLQSERFVVPAKQSIIGGCGDERLSTNSTRLLLPPVFGGWFSAVLADALTTRLWYRSGMTAERHALAMAEAVRQMQPSATLCVHTDEHALQAEECGCAAIAKAAAVVELLTDYTDLIDERFRDQILANARELLSTGYFKPGTAHFVDELERHGVAKEVLAGSHTGVAVMTNDDEGTLYDRPAFYAWCKQQALPVTSFFEYSRWAMRATARQLTPSAAAGDFFFAAADAFNCAVAYAICNADTVMLERR